jgi:ABC-type amino acid transport substrate-binding protein
LTLALLASAILLPADNMQAQTLARVKQAGALKLGYYTNARPFSYQDDAGKPAGYGVALCQEIAKDIKAELGLPSLGVEFVAVTTADRFDSLQQGKIDLLCGPSVETLARRKEVSYSTPIFPGGIGALMRADSPSQIQDILIGREPPYRPQWRGSVGLALQKRTFSAVPNTTAMSWLTGKLDEFKIDAKIVPVDNFETGVQNVLNRSTDVLFGERSILLDEKKRSPSGGDLIVLDRLFTIEPVGFALARGDEDFRLAVDKSLSRLFRTGTAQSLFRQYLGEPDANTLNFFRLCILPD